MHRCCTAFACATVIAALSTGPASAQTPAPAQATPAPAAGSPGIYKAAAELAAQLTRATPTGGMTTSAVSNTDQYRVNIVHRETPAGAVAHPGNTELHYIIEGAGTIVTGGSIVRPTGAGAQATIENGVARRVSKGDVVIVPVNTPHWYRDLDGPITYLEVRFVAPVQ